MFAERSQCGRGAAYRFPLMAARFYAQKAGLDPFRRICKILPASLPIPDQIQSQTSDQSGSSIPLCAPQSAWESAHDSSRTIVETREFRDMSESQLRVKLLVAAGIVGASLLGATFVGCSSAPPSQASTPFASYNGSPMAPGGGMPQAAYAGQPAAAPGINGYSQQNRQALMAETQRLGTQQNLSAQDVIAMSRSGVPDTQIAMAIQQRGAGLRATPGADRYLAANGVNPAVLGVAADKIRSSPYPGLCARTTGCRRRNAATTGLSAGGHAIRTGRTHELRSCRYACGHADAGERIAGRRAPGSISRLPDFRRHARLRCVGSLGCRPIVASHASLSLQKTHVSSLL